MDVHHHIDQGFDFRGPPAFSDVAQELAMVGKALENGALFFKHAFVSCAHEVQRACARLLNRGCHTRLEARGPSVLAPLRHRLVCCGCKGRAVDEIASLGAHEQVVLSAFEDRKLGRVIRDNRKDRLSPLRDFCKRGARRGTQFSGELQGALRTGVKYGGNAEALFFEVPSHVGSHAAHADEA